MSFTQFIKPYPDGYEDFEVGGTPVTAEILNINYDGFLLALNEFLPELEGMVEANPSESATAGNLTKLKVGNSIYLIPSGGSGGSSVEWEQIQLTGTKIATITIDNVPVDVYAPSGGSGGDSVSWTQTIGSGTKIGTITINGIPTDVYAPTPIDVEANPSGSATAGDLTKLKVGSSIYSIPSGGSGGASDLSDLDDVSITNVQNGQTIKWNSTTLKWENANESGGTGGHTIIDENGNSMTARAGLQFVGANVSDDATNNKTIVDLASAGGIDGVFPDLSNDLGVTFTFDSTQHTWEATEDCVIGWNLIAIDSGTGAYIDIIDGADSLRVFNSYEYQHGAGGWTLVKKGQTVSYRAKASTSGGGFVSSIKAYGIQTGTTHSKFQPVIYSTEEREIGVWTDGKPLYSKVIEIQSFSNSSPISIDVSSLNVDTMVDVVGEAYAISNNVIGETLYFPVYNFANTYTAQIRFVTNTIQIYHERLNDYTSGILKILYTKTTDTAGSGTWTPQGVPTHHYSTDEHIIGTWIDGSTLYEKTLVFDNPTKDSYGTFYQYDCAYDSGNIDFARMVGINVYDSTDNIWYDIPYERLSSDEDIKAMDMVVSHDYKCLVFFKNTQAYNLTKIVYTIQYTKLS